MNIGRRALMLALAMLLMAPSIPVSSAQQAPPPPGLHDAPDPTVPQPPQVPGRPLGDTDIIPIDNLQDSVMGAVDANNKTAPLAAGANDALAKGKQAAPAGTLTLFGDGFEGSRAGGYGAWQTQPPTDPGKPLAWGVAGNSSSGHVLTTGTLDQGRYAGSTTSLLVTPELDLRTGTLPDAGVPPSAVAKLAALADVIALVDGNLPPSLDPACLEKLCTTTDPPYENLRATLRGSSSPQAPPGIASSAIYRMVLTDEAGALFGNCFLFVRVCVAPDPLGGVSPKHAGEPRDSAWTLSFQRRFNLAGDAHLADGHPGRDGVRILVFTKEPTLDDVEGCFSAEDAERGDNSILLRASADVPPRDAPVCTKVQTLAGDGRPVRPFRNPLSPDGYDDGYTGYGDWATDYVDLTSWAGQSVWVAFESATGGIGGAGYFQDKDLFNTAAGFRGFQLDNVTLRVPAQQQSLRVRPFSEPSTKPDTTQNITLAVGSDVPVAVDVANVGTNPLTATLHLQVADRDNASAPPLRDVVLGNVTIPPAGIHRATAVLHGLTARPANYTLTLRAETVATNATTPEADPGDDAATQVLDILDVPLLRTGALERSSPSITKDGSETFRLEVRNAGNVPTNVTATAEVISAETHNATAALPFEGVGATYHDIPLAVGEHRTFEWRMSGASNALQPGQYQLFVHINDPDDFDAARDLLPASLQPFRSTWAATAPTVDGALEGAWTQLAQPAEFRDPYNARPGDGHDAAAQDQVLKGAMRVMNDADHLYVAFEVPQQAPGTLALLVDNKADGAGATGVDNGFLASGDNGTADLVRRDLTYVDPERVQAGDIRILGGGLPAFQAVGGASPDVGRPLSDGNRLDLIRATGDSVTYLDLDDSGTISRGDFKLTGTPGENASTVARFVAENDPALGTSLAPDGTIGGPANFCFADSTGPGLHDRSYDAGEPVIAQASGHQYTLLAGMANAGTAVSCVAGTAVQPFSPVQPTVRYYDADHDGAFDGNDTLYLQPWRIPWSPATGLGGVAGVKTTTAAPLTTTYELRLPLQGAHAGDRLRLAAVLDGAGVPYRFPAAPLVDGEGFAPRNGNLSDELASWFPVILAGPPVPHVATGTRLLSLGFGVERAPPAMFEEPLRDCSGLSGWSQTGILPPYSHGLEGQMGRTADKWNCAPYGPDGRPRLYEGLSPTSQCGEADCQPWSGVQGVAPVGDDRFNPNDLVSPPFRIGPVANPYLVLRHQYSTESYINDESDAVRRVTGPFQYDLPSHGMELATFARVLVQPWNEKAQAWEPPVLVRPLGGYSTEESNGIQLDSGQNRDLRAPLGTARCTSDVDTKQIVPPCGWWAPTGYQGHAQPPGTDYAAGEGLRGSPWTVDRLPLFGSGHGFGENKTLSLANRTVRLLFEFYPSTGVADPDARFPQDLGWRIDGLAVTEGPQFAKDVAVTNLTVAATSYDPAVLGLGPGTTVLVNVTVRNEGLQAANGVHVCLSALDLGSGAGADPCRDGQEAALETLPAGATRAVLVPFEVPAEEGRLLAFHAAARVESGDDFPANNELRDTQVYRTHAARDAAIVVDASPRDGSPATARTLLLQVANLGNVPLTDFDVVRTVVRSDGADRGTPILRPKTWHVADTLPVGAARDLQAFNETMVTPSVGKNDLVLAAPGRTGTFTLFGQVRLPGDAVPTNDVGTTTLRALDVLYQENFDGALSGDAAKAGPVWSVQPGGFTGKRLLAGDPASGEIPPNTDATFELPPIDLSSAKDAVLTFRQRYDLEQGFDAGRVEVSRDDGKTWSLLRPVPHAGTPLGYPSLNLTGTNALLGGAGDATGVAFTGSSADLPGASNGWALSEFNLASDPGLSRLDTVDDFRLDGFSARPAAEPSPAPSGELQFRAGDWVMPDANAEAQQRYWWIQNLTYDSPRPHGGGQMWWSGTSGPEAAGAVRDDLAYRLTVPTIDPAPGRQVLFTWWEWRAGGLDGGTGATRVASVDDHPRTAFLLAEEPSGWRQMALDLTDLQGHQATVRFSYDSVAAPGFDDPRTANNLGWFLDDFQLVASQQDLARGLRLPPVALKPADGVEGLDSTGISADGSLGNWTTRAVPGSPAAGPTRWSLVGLGRAAQDGGWHVESLQVPGRGQTTAWRFSSDSAQGYPDDADARLVTPVVDLGAAQGDVRLQFDQRYWFESALKCPLDQARPSSPQAQQALGCFRSAIDGGAVEYQVLDPATGTFGPWKALGADFDQFPDHLLFEAKTDDCQSGSYPKHAHDADPPSSFGGPCTDPNRRVDRLSARGSSRTLLDSTGYSAIEERGERSWYVSPDCADVDPVPAYLPAGHGSQLVPQPGLAQFDIEGCSDILNADAPDDFLQPWRPYPVSYVFSGASPGPQGWQTVSWDASPLAGHQVRFAFHAFSNPGFVAPPGAPPASQRGWSLANVAVVGNAFEGKPVRVRFHVATDGSIPAGEWSIDDIALSGATFRRNMAVRPDGNGTVEARSDSIVRLTGRLANLASPAPGNAQSGLALAVWAVREDGGLRPFTDWSAASSPALEQLDLPAGYPEGAQGFRMPLLLGGASQPLAFDVHVPGGDSTVRLRFAILQDVGATEAVGGTFVHTADYRPFVGEVSGNTESSWVVHGSRRTSVLLSSPVAGRAGPILADPALAAPGQAIALSAAFQNNGTTEPAVTATWQVLEVQHKASPSQQGLKPEQTSVASPKKDTAFDALPRGATRVTTTSFTPQGPGLYRALLVLHTGSTVLASASSEFLVLAPGTSPSYYGVDFTHGDAPGWAARAKAPDPDAGDGSPPWLDFRASPGAYRWGVDPDQFGAQQTYCTLAQCNYPSQKGNQNTVPPIGDVTGLNGTAWGPDDIRLDTVPQGHAFLTLRHEVNLEDGDGARVEAIPMKDDAPDAAAFACADGSPMPFILRPEPQAAYAASVQSVPGAQYDPVNVPMGQSLPGESVPNRHNALAYPLGSPDTAFGGTLPPGQVTRFRLDQVAESACRNSKGAYEHVVLVNYTIRPVLHVATLPGFTSTQGGNDVRKGAEGWAIAGLSITPASVELQPAQHTYEVQGGAAKDFLVTLRNAGDIQDQVALAVDARNSTLPDPAWVALPPAPLTMAPGESRAVVLRIQPPAGPDLRPGIYTVPIVARSLTDPDARSVLQATVVIGRLVLGDLSVLLSTDAGQEPAFATGAVEPIHATVLNVGQAPTRPTQVVLEATADGTGTTVELGRRDVPALCAKGRPGCSLADAQRTFSLDWSVPIDAGNYTLSARVDPDGRLLEASKANDVATLAVNVSRPALGDLEVGPIQVSGFGADGSAQDGDVLAFAVNVTNVGTAAVGAFRVRLLVNNTLAITQDAAGLAPGRVQRFVFSTTVPGGTIAVRATALPSPGSDGDADNNDRRITLRVQSHDLRLQAVPAEPALDALGVADLQLNVTNAGNAVEHLVLRLDDAPGWGLRANPNPIVVAPGQQAAASLALQAPPNVAAGRQVLRLVAVSAENPVARATLLLPVDVPARGGAPALEAGVQQVTPGPAVLALRLISTSNVDQEVNVSVVQPGWTSTVEHATLPAGGNASLELNVLVPGNTTPGRHGVAVAAAVPGLPPVQGILDVDVAPLAAITGTWSGAVHRQVADQGTVRFAMDLHLVNTGNVEATPHVTLRDLGPGLTAGDVAAGGALAPGESRIVPVTLDMAADAPGSLLGRADVWAEPVQPGQAAAAGTADDGTVLSQTLDLPAPGAAPDLRVVRADPTPRTGLAEGKPLRIAIQVQNTGDSEAAPSVLFVSANGLLVQPVQVPALAPGASAPVNATLTFTKAGPFVLTFMADGDGTVEERNDDDNGMSIDVDVAPSGMASHLHGAPSLDFALVALGLAALAAASRRRRA